MQVALKVDVDTLRGTLEGVPALLRLFDRLGVRATFLFSLGPDHTGRAIKRIFRPGFLAKVRRTSVTSHYGIRTLLYGTLLPGPDIGRRAGDVMRATAAAGHEVGIHCHDHIRWQDHVRNRDAAWTRREMTRAAEAFERVFGRPAQAHGAAGWQVNAPALVFEEQAGYRWASDTRGSSPFLPVMDGTTSRCPQIPTTLPTLDELLGLEGISAGNVHEHVLAASARGLPHGHVYTLHAELEGMQLLGVMERLVEAWRGAGHPVVAVDDVADRLHSGSLPVHEVVWGEVAGRSGQLALQGPPLAVAR